MAKDLFEITNPNGGIFSINRNGSVTSGARAARQARLNGHKFAESIGGHASNYKSGHGVK